MLNLNRLKIVHPILFAAFPIMFLFSHNVNQVSLNEIAIPLVIVICFALLLWFLLSLLFKDKEKAGIIVSIFLLLFFSYGHVLDSISGLTMGKMVIGTHRYVLLLWGLLFIVGTYLIRKTRRNLQQLTTLLNVLAVSLVAMTIMKGVYAYSWQDMINIENKIENKEDATNLVRPDKRPDIYYIILDAYARADVLKEVFQYDNTPFLDRLVQKGFYIADRSRANYSSTFPSLASSLNLDYLDNLLGQYGIEPDSKIPNTVVKQMVNNNRVFNFLKQQGYRIVFVCSNRYIGNVINTADIHISAPSWSPTEFQNELMNTTPIPILFHVFTIAPRNELHRLGILYTLDHLAYMAKEVEKDDSPVFVFSHLLAPHEPFVFGKNGERVNPDTKFSIGLTALTKDKYVERYKNQLIFINKKIEKAVDAILSGSPEPPIIILQSDHGPVGPIFDWKNASNSKIKERTSILNAYYIPDNNGYKKLYRNITPVNTFRIIFNQYFGTNYQLLEDKIYFANITNIVKSGP